MGSNLLRRSLRPLPDCFSIERSNNRSIPRGFGKIGMQIAPGVTRAAVLRDAAQTAGTGQWGAIQTAAPSFGVEVSPINVRDAPEIERAVRPSRAPLAAA